MAASLDAGPCLEDILSHHGLEKKDLERQCPPGTRITIATKLVDWKTTGHYFGVPAEKLAAIDRENATEDQRRVALLDCWEKREGRNANCLKLADVLHRRERRDLVELLCKEVKLSLTSSKNENASSDGKQLQSCASGIDIAKRIDTLQNQFHGLHRQFRSELNEQQVSVDDLLSELTLLPIECRKEYQHLIQQMLPTLEESTRITTLFNRLNPLFTFIDYGLLKHLISNLGSIELKEDMTSYVDEVQEFMRETTVGDVIDYWPGDEESHANYSRLRAKFKDDPKTYTLERLNNFRRKFCSRVRLSEFIFGLISLEPSESFFVTWLIPTVIVPELLKSICQIEHSFIESEHLLSITVDQDQLYPPATADIVSPLPVVVRSPQQKPLEVRQAGDLITTTITPVSTMAKKDVQSKISTDDIVNIIVIGYGWNGASEFTKGIIGQSKDNNVKLWDCFGEWCPISERDVVTREVEEKKESIIAKCRTLSLVLFYNDLESLFCSTVKSFSDPCLMGYISGFTVSDLTRLFDHSIWNNTIIVQPFEQECSHQSCADFHLSQYKITLEESKPKYKWSGVDPEVISNIPVIPINISYPSLPDRVDWLSPFWDTCLQRMTESAQHTFLRANADRIKLAAAGQKRDDGDKPLHERAIYYVPGPNASEVPIHSAVSNLLGTEVTIELRHLRAASKSSNQPQNQDDEDAHRPLSQM